MIRRNKYILVFSIIYWVVALIGVVLFSVSFQKVPIGYYGLKANYFSPKIESSFYSPGLYDIGVGYYFILFPSTKQYLVDNQVAIINQNLEKLVVTYTLVYKIDPSKIGDLYSTSGYDYTKTLVASANNIISGIFNTVTQDQSRVTVQSKIATNLLTSTNKVAISLGSAVAVQAFFINQIAFPEEVEKEYLQSMQLSDSYQQSFETTQIQYRKTLLQIQNVRSTIALLKQQYKFAAEQAYSQRFQEVFTTDLTNYQANEAEMSAKYNMKRIWTYYNSTKMIFI